jgi:hypothetical protein
MRCDVSTEIRRGLREGSGEEYILIIVIGLDWIGLDWIASN